MTTTAPALPPVTDAETWQRELAALRDGDTVYRTWHTDGRGTEQLSHTFPLVDVLPYGRQEVWQDSPPGWPQSATYEKWLESEDIAAFYGPKGRS